MKKVCIINVVGLTPELATHAPTLAGLGAIRPFESPFPAVTCTSQATMLTGEPPSKHGIVGNGWYFRDTQEIRFWQQSNALIQAEPLYRNIHTAKLFWWYNLGSGVEHWITPRPHYGSDGSKSFAVWDETGCDLCETFGDFPFHSFWGPAAGLASSQWIANSSAKVLREKKPDLSLIYLPHLDYDYQRRTPGDLTRVKEVECCAKTVLDAARDIEAEVVVVSEYGLVPVDKAVFLNKLFRQRNWLHVRPGPYGEMLQPQESKAFAVTDHQLAHIYINGLDKKEVQHAIEELDGIEQVVEPGELELDHPRSGELIALSKSDAWFAYPYWLDDANKPDFASSVDIHRKPGYDPLELFMTSKLKALKSLVKKKLGFRYRFDVVPLDTSLIKGSHGLRPEPDKGPVIIGPGGLPTRMVDFKSYILDLMSK